MNQYPPPPPPGNRPPYQGPPQQYPPQGPQYPQQQPPPGYYQQQPQQWGPPPAPGLNWARIVIGVVAGIAILISFTYLYAALGLGKSSGSGAGSILPTMREELVVNEFFTLADGAQQSWRITPGRYRVDLTASDGASVVWIGTGCQGARETKVFNTLCAVATGGQLIVGNPTTFGMGASSTITLRVVRLP